MPAFLARLVMGEMGEEFLLDLAQPGEGWLHRRRHLLHAGGQRHAAGGDLVVDRGAFDRIIQAGGYVNVNTGGVPDANEIPIPKHIADEAFDSATCIACGACVAACKNASAALFVSAKT